MSIRKISILFTISILQFGCGDETSSSGDTASSATGSQATTSVQIAGQDSVLGDGVTTSGQQVAEGYGMTFSDTAMDENIPALPIFGFANGQPFNAGTVVFRYDHEGKWHLEVSDHKFDPTKGPAHGRLTKKDLQTVYLTLPEEPGAGVTMGRGMEYGGGYFQIKKTADSQDTTSWNTSFAYKLEIEKWEMGAARVSSCGQPPIGSATGKLFFSFKGASGVIKKSWISGQFTDAAILYCAE